MWLSRIADIPQSVLPFFHSNRLIWIHKCPAKYNISHCPLQLGLMSYFWLPGYKCHFHFTSLKIIKLHFLLGPLLPSSRPEHKHSELSPTMQMRIKETAPLEPLKELHIQNGRAAPPAWVSGWSHIIKSATPPWTVNMREINFYLKYTFLHLCYSSFIYTVSQRVK